MRKILLKHLAALKKVSMLFAVCALGTNMSAQILAESFENPSGDLPTGWTNFFMADQFIFYTQPGEASHGNRCVRLGNQQNNGSSEAFISTPSIALTAGQTIKISFDYSVAEMNGIGGNINIYIHESKNVNIFGLDNYIHKIDFTTTSAYTTVNLTFTAEETKEYYITFFARGIPPALSNINMFKFLLDRVIVEDSLTCPAPTDIVVTQTAANVVNLDWNEVGNGTPWEVQLTSGDFPNSVGWIAAGTSQKDISITPGRTYSAYVRSKCPGGGYSSFYGPKIFSVPCVDVITAPYTVPFITKNLPECWQQSGDTNWVFSIPADYAARNAGDHSLFEGYTQYAWVDATYNTSNKKTTLLSPKVDVSGLTNPAIEFYAYSENNNNSIFNELTAEVFNGTAWQTAITHSTATGGWKLFSIDLTSLNITGTTQLRITIKGNTENEENYFNDILIDDISFREKTTCLPLRNFSVGLITNASATISWDAVNNVTWDISYGKHDYSFDGIADVSGTSNTYTLNGLEPSTHYQVYIRANCGNGAVGEWTGPYNLKTDCAVIVPVYTQNFESYSPPGSGQQLIPNCWEMASGGDLASGPSEYGTGGWGSNDSAAYGIQNGSFTNSEAVSISFLGSDIKSWILSPLFDLSDNQYEIKIRIALDPESTAPISMGSDDKVQMLYSTDGTTWNILKTWSAEDNLTTGYNTSIIPLDGINGESVRFAFLADEGVVMDEILYKFHLDDLVIREKSICTEAVNLFADGITHQSAKIGWENPGIATSWKVAVVPAGVAPTNEWQTALNNPYTAQNLTENTLYDVYVKSICGGIESEVTTGPFKFRTRCAPIVAPHTETFVEYYAVPECWTFTPTQINFQLFLVDFWNFTTDAKFEASLAGDHTAGGETQYAWLNVGGLSNKERGFLTTPLVDVSTLQNPALQFYVFSKNSIDNALNHLIVEVYNGTQWVEATRIENYTNGWAPYTIDLAALGATGIIEVRFTVIVNSNGGNAGYNNILIDDVAFIEMPECSAPINLVVTEITDTTAEVTWEDQGASTSWEIEYGPKGFIPGEGTVLTVNTNTEVTLTDLDDNLEYDVYIKSVCDSELIGPQTFITETTSGINDPEINKAILYPNPVTDMLNIESNTTIDTIEIYNIVGQLVKKQSFNTNSAIVIISDISEGVYMVKAFSGKNVGTYKIIKK